jgi:hypothetical protein
MSMKALDLSGLRRLKLAATLATACMTVCSASLGAQVVRGTIVDELNGQPVVGAWVLLLDSLGRDHSRSLSDALGRFVVRGEGAGVYRLRAILIGYTKWESEPFQLQVGETREEEIPLSLMRVALPALTVEAERTCQVRPGEGMATTALWEEVKKALAATEWTIEQRLYRFRSAMTRRTLDGSFAPLSDTTYGRVGYSDWPFRSLAADSLSRYGFVQSAPGGPIYYGPDAQVLVSDVFLDEHCFRVQRHDADTAGLIGLAFEPVRDSRLPDIEGVLWVDSASIALQELEFHYVRLGRWVPSRRAGGSVRFASLPTGAWFIRRWRMWGPIGRVSTPGDTVLHGYLERGGEVLEVRSATGDLIVRFEPEGTDDR